MNQVIAVFIAVIFFLIGPFIGASAADFIFRRRTDQVLRSGIGASIRFWSALTAKLI